MKHIYKITLIIILFASISCSTNKEASKNDDKTSFNDIERGYFRIMFYNVENLFDTFDDTLKNDDEFLPNGNKYWNNRKYYKKINNISKVITAVGGWEPPEIIGLCEIENRYVLDGITKFTPLKKYKYRIIHDESPDKRGIDVGLLYQQDKFTPIKYQSISINFPNNARKTRDILYVEGKTTKNDTLHIFINHWPSRWGGQLESEPKRIFVANVLRDVVDSIFTANKNANIIITGDFNDEPDNKSLIEALGAKTKYTDIKANELYNLSFYLKDKKGLGSHKYQGNWGILDQFIVSGNLFNSNNRINTSLNDVHVFNADFLLEKDERNIGEKPFRTYIGFKFNNGFSDHLPVFLDLKRKSK